MASTIFKTSSTADSVLFKVKEFINIDKKQQALDIIYSFVVSNKAKQWSREFERLMLHLVDLSIEFEKQSFLTEGLLFFKEISEAHNADSFKYVCDYYRQKLENNLNDCIKVFNDKEELYYEMNNKYDAQAFFFNSLDDKEGRIKERFKKSWRNLCYGYFNIIDLTFSSRKLFSSYIDFSKSFMILIETHEQMQDFTMFIEHLINKQQKLQRTQSGQSTLKNPEINYKLLQQRKDQLEVSQRLNLIQEAFMILESINFLIFCKKSLNRDLSYYYENLSIIFEKGNFRYFQVLALQNNFFNLVKAKSEKDILKQVAEKIILATLSVNSKSEEFFLSENLLQKYQFLFPGLQLEVNLENLYKNIDQMNLIEFCDDNIKDLYYTCTGRYSIYDFSDHIVEGLEKLSEEVKGYRPLIQQNSIQIILNLLSNYFTNISFTELKEFTKFTDFNKVKQFILKSIIDKTINVKLNYKEQMVEFPDNQIDVSNIKNFQNKLLNTKKNLILNLIKYQSQNSKSQNDINQQFIDYVTYIRNEKQQQQAEALENEKKFLQSKIKIVKRPEISEEEQKRQQRLNEIDERNKLIERKMLGEKKKLIEQLLKLKPDVEILSKPLSKYTDEEIVQINIDFFMSIGEDIQKEKENRTKNKIEKSFNIYDYFKRQELKKYFENLVECRKKEKVNLEDLADQRVELEKLQEEKRKEMEIAQAFMEDFQIELYEQAEQELENDEKQFVEQLEKNFGEEVLKAAREKYEKLQKEKREQQLKNPNQKRRGFTGLKSQSGTSYGNQQRNDFNRSSNQQQQQAPLPQIGLAKRGENFEQKKDFSKTLTRQPLQRNDKLQRQDNRPQRSTQEPVKLTRGIGNQQQPTKISRGIGNQQQPTKLSRGTQQQQTKLSGRGQGLMRPKQDTQKKPQQAPLRRGFGQTKKQN